MNIYDNELEQKILGGLINSPQESLIAARESLSAEHFYSDAHRDLYKMICSLNDKGLDADLLTLSEELRNRETHLTQIQLVEISQNYTVSFSQLKQYIDILISLTKRRRLWLLGNELVSKSESAGSDVNEMLDNIQSSVDAINNMGYSNSDAMTLTDVLTDLTNRIGTNMLGKSANGVTYTGFPYIDANGGFEAGTLIIIGAQSSIGKTSLADSFALNVIKQHVPIAFYSLEMTQIRITARLLASESGVSSQRLYNDKLDEDEYFKVNRDIGEMNQYSDYLFFPRKPKHTLASILKSIRYFKSKNNIKGAVVDYIQLLNGETAKQNREQFIGECAHALQALAKELNIWIVLLSQINRGINANNPIPSRDCLRDSGQIVEAADVIYLIYRPSYYNSTEGTELTYPAPYESIDTEGTAMIITAKNRNGVVGSFICGFDSDTTAFFPLNTLPSKGEGKDTTKQRTKYVIIPD